MCDSMIIYMVTLIRRKFVHNRVGSIWAMEYNGVGKGGGVIAADDKVCAARIRNHTYLCFLIRPSGLRMARQILSKMCSPGYTVHTS